MFVAVCTLSLLAIIGVAVDGSGALRALERADFLAAEAARAGGQAIAPAQAVTGEAIVVDSTAAQAAARAYLQTEGITGTVTVSADSTTLTVRVHVRYPTHFLPVTGVGSLQVTGQAHASLLHGRNAPEGP